MSNELNSKETKLASYISFNITEHFRLYLNNKDVIKNKDVCFFCLKSIFRVRKLKRMEFGFVERDLVNYDFLFLQKLADSMGYQFSENEFIPRLIFSCYSCEELIKDPDRLFYLEENPKTEEEKKNNISLWICISFLIHLALGIVLYDLKVSL